MNENLDNINIPMSDSQRIEEQARKISGKKAIRKRKAKSVFPKKNRSAYIFFTQEYKNEALKHRPNCHLNTLMKEIAEKWAALPESSKLPYKKLAHQDKIRYFQEKKRFLEDCSRALIPKCEKKRKKPSFISPYILFARDERARLRVSAPALNPVEIMKEIANRWKTLSDESRKTYYQESERIKKERDLRDNRDIEAFFAGLRHKKKKARFEGEKARFKSSPFLIFCKEKRTQEKAKNVTDLSEIWQSLSPRQKKEYEVKYFLEKEHFNLLRVSQETSQITEKPNLSNNSAGTIADFQRENEKKSNKPASFESFLNDYSRFLQAKRNLGS